MAFVLSGSTITQSGTDASLSGLSAIAGVVSNTSADGVVSYYIPSIITLFDITGTLTHDPDFEILRLSVSTQMRVGGTYNYGVQRTLNGKTTYSKGTGLIMPRTTTTGAGINTNLANLQFLNGSTFNTKGGIIASRGVIYFGSDTTGTNTITINIAGKTKFLNLNASNPVHLIRAFCVASGINIEVDLDGTTQSSVPFSTNGFNSFSAVLNNATLQSDGNGPKDPVTVLNGVFANNAALSDYFYNPYSGGNLNKYILQNPDVGNQIRTAGVGNAPTTRIGCLEIWKNVAITALNTSGVSISGAVIYTKLLGASMNPSGRYAGVDDYMTSRVYLASNGSSINLLYGVYQGYSGTAGDPLTNDVLANLGTGDDNKFYLLAYGYAITEDVESLRRINTLSVGVRILADSNVTLTETNAVAKLASSFAVDRATNTITVTNNSTLDDLYDAMKAYKTRNVQAQLEYLGIANQIVNANGSIADAGSMNIVGIEKLSAGTKFKSLKTTGSITAVGAFTIGVVGNVSQATPTNLSGVSITGNLTYNTNTDITVTLMNSSISGTIINSGTGNVKLNLVNSTVNTGTRVTAQYPITITDANGANFSTQIWVFNSGGNIVEDTGFNSLVASKTVYMPVGGSIRVYSQAYGTQSKITNTNATNASLVITHIPETLVDTSLPTITRNTVAGYFSSVVENSLLYVEVDTDLANYTPAEVLNAMHYFIVSNGGNFAALSLLANTVGSVKLIDGGFRVYSAFFKGRAKSNLNATNTPSLYITLPLYIEDASGVAGNQVMVRNANGIDVHAALWSKATANISQNDMNSIAGTTWSHNKRTLNDAIFE